MNRVMSKTGKRIMKTLDRRAVLAGTAGALALGGSRSLQAAMAVTPVQTEGPFYPRPEDLPGDRDADLVRVAGAVKQAGGRILHLTGSVTGRDGAPLAGALVEIWQCDANGRYLHGRDWSLFRDRDPDFQGYGKTLTGPDGRYAFRTIKPVPYPGRTPHIHFKVRDPRGGAVLTTQMYVAGEGQNDADTLYRYLSADQRKALTVALTEGAGGELEGDFRIVL